MKFVALVLLLMLLVSPPLRAQELPSVGSYSDDARAARISELKVKYRISLNDQEKVRIRERCLTAKNNIAKLSARVRASTEMRSATYESIVASLSALRVMVAARQVDASNLELLIVDYQQADTAFTIASTTYETAIEDALLIDCASNPEGFRASVEGIREARKITVEAVSAIESLTSSNLKTAFDTLKLRLEASEVASGR